VNDGLSLSSSDSVNCVVRKHLERFAGFAMCNIAECDISLKINKAQFSCRKM